MTRFTDERRDFTNEMGAELDALFERAEAMGFDVMQNGGDITVLRRYDTPTHSIEIIARDYDGVPEDVNDPVIVTLYQDVGDEGIPHDFPTLRKALVFVADLDIPNE